MPSTLTNDFKSEFALLLVIMKINYGTASALNYSKTLFEWTLAALVTEGKVTVEIECENTVIKDVGSFRLASKLMFAKRKYMEALGMVLARPVPGQKEWAQKNLLDACFAVDEIMFSIALSEGVLDLKDVTNKVMSGMGNLNMNREAEGT